MLDRYPKSSSQQLIRAITLTKVLAATPQDLLLLARAARSLTAPLSSACAGPAAAG